VYSVSVAANTSLSIVFPKPISIEPGEYLSIIGKTIGGNVNIVANNCAVTLNTSENQ
jgi:hypothetical protein